MQLAQGRKSLVEAAARYFKARAESVAKRWLVEHGKKKDEMLLIGRAATAVQAAELAQTHFDYALETSRNERIVFDVVRPAGEYPSSAGWYRITRVRKEGEYPPGGGHTGCNSDTT